MEATALHPRSFAHCAAEAPAGIEVEDDELVSRALAGGEGALALLADRYRRRVYAFSFAMLRNAEDAEDVAQDTLIRAFGSLRSYRQRGHFKAWLFRIAGNLCRDRLRQRRTLPLQEVEERAAPAGSEDSDLRHVLFGAVGRLPETYRGPVVLHYMEGLSVSETAAALGRTQTAVRVQLWRARGMLAADLQGWWREERR